MTSGKIPWLGYGVALKQFGEPETLSELFGQNSETEKNLFGWGSPWAPTRNVSEGAFPIDIQPFLLCDQP